MTVRLRMRFAFGVFLFGALAFLSSARPASASSAAGGNAPAKASGSSQWDDQKSFVDCGQSCLYQKANENLSLQALYLVQKIGALKDLKDQGKDSAILNNLQGFCLQGEVGADCFNRYKRLQVFALQKIRAAMVQNADAAARLRSEAPVVSYGDGKTRKPQVPYVVTYEDLKKEYAELQRLGGEDYRQWADSRPFKPSKDDFVKFKTIYRDPENPKAGTLQIVERDASGNVAYDDAAYQRALKNYENQMEGQNGDLSKVRAGKGNQLKGNDVEKNSGSVSVGAFKESHKEIVETVNSSFGGIRSVSEVNYGPQPRKPANASAATAATGNEPVIPPPSSGGERRFVTFDMGVGGAQGSDTKGDPKEFNLLQEIQNIDKY